jgi:hypothetical protein
VPSFFVKALIISLEVAVEATPFTIVIFHYELGQGGLFRSQISRHLVVCSVVVQVVVFLLDDNLKVL